MGPSRKETRTGGIDTGPIRYRYIGCRHAGPSGKEMQTGGVDTWGPAGIDMQGIDTRAQQEGDANGRYRHAGSSRYRHAGYRHAGPSRMGIGTGKGETEVMAEVVGCVGAFPRHRFCSAPSAPSPSEGIWEV